MEGKQVTFDAITLKIIEEGKHVHVYMVDNAHFNTTCAAFSLQIK